MDEDDIRRARARQRVAVALPTAPSAGVPDARPDGLPAVPDRPGGPTPHGRRGPPGRLLNPDEAAALVRGASLPADAAARFGERLTEMLASGLVPETSDAEARAHLARRREAGLGGIPPLAIAGPAQARLRGPAQARLAAPEGGAPPGAVVAVPARPAHSLPAALGRRAPVPHDPSWLPEPEAVEPRWWSVYDAPAYLMAVVRANGEHAFRSFPCFSAHREAAVAAGEDPLGSVRILACLDGSKPNGSGEIEHVARWIHGNGTVVAAHKLAFPTIVGYEPRVVLAAHGGVSYLLVEETRERGAPIDARYVYAWKGGMDFYDGNRPALAAMRALAAPDAGRAPGQRGRRLPAPETAPLLPTRVVAVDVAAERRRIAQHVKSLPQAAATTVTTDLLQGLRAMGFRKMGTPEGPVLRMDVEDGSVVLSAPRGTALTEATVLMGRRLDAEGCVTDEAEVSEVADAERLVEPAPSPSP